MTERLFPRWRLSMIAWLKTGILMAAITALFGAIGGAVGGQSGMMMALGFAVVTNFFAYWFSDKMVLKMYNAQEVDESSAPQYYNMVRELAHVKHRDILISTISATMAGAISALANFAMFFGGRSEDGRPNNPILTIATA